MIFWEIEKFILFRFFFKIIFLHAEKIFFDDIFLKSHLRYQDNHFDTVSERFYPLKVLKNPII